MKPNIETELNELETLLGRLRSGELSRAEFRSHSVHYGVYTQRQEDRFFVRVRVPYGTISPAQLWALAVAIEKWGTGVCRFTTRQGVEVQGLSLEQIMPLLQALGEVGLQSHETGGNSIRSVLACPHAGVGLDEPFDVTPYAQLLTRCLMRHPEFQNLPRKMKIGFSCCEEDCARTSVQDLGFQARTNAAGACGFRVLVGGGTGAAPRLGQVLEEFLPAHQIISFTRAFLRVFNRLGDRQNRRRARVKFLVQRLGLEDLRQETHREWEALQRESQSDSADLTAPPAPEPIEPAEEELADLKGQPQTADEVFQGWVDAQTQLQQQRGFRTVRVSLAGGWITADQLRGLAEVSEQFDLTVRTTPEQGFLMRWVGKDQLADVYQVLAETRLLRRLAVSRLMACPGTSGCSNAFTHTPALAQAITARLAALPHPASELGHLRIRLSGCPNGCGLHATADIGLEGVAQRTGNEWWPAYRVWLGGQDCQTEPRLAEDLGLVPARYVPECVADLAAYYLDARQLHEALPKFVDRIGIEPFAALVRKHRLNSALDRSNLKIDWGEMESYRPPIAKAAGVC